MNIGNCSICNREMISGSSVDKHHWTPKSKGGKITEIIHRICHTKIHSLFTEKELALYYNTAEKLKAHPAIQKFIKWVSKKEPEYYDKNKKSKLKV